MGQPVPIPLTEGMYEARSCIANAQRCVNLYPEVNASDSPFPFTFYPTPGLKVVFTPALSAAARASYTASNGNLYYLVGKALYYIAPNFVGTKLGDITTAGGPVSMADNGTTLWLVDGTTRAYLVDLATNAFSIYGDVNYLGSDRVAFLDGFMLFNQPATRNFYSTLLYSTTIDPTYIAARVGASDPLKGVVVNSRQAYLLGTKTSEVWGNAGSPSFPFQAISGAFIRHGIATVFSIALYDSAIYAVAQSPEGKGYIIAISGYAAQRISTPAIEAELSKYSTLQDAISFVYSQSGHTFYVVSFPTGDTTFAYDISTGKWCERSWCDADGQEHRWRAQCAAFAYEAVVVGDWENGKLYSLELEQYNDFGGPIVRRKGFPHIVASGRQAIYEQFQAEMEVANAGPTAALPEVSLRYSTTRGRSWSYPMTQSLGAIGEYNLVPQWRGLGQSRDMVFELFWSADVKTALNGAYADITPTGA